MIKEHPILFSTPMVQAILEGRKTQTRRGVTAHNSKVPLDKKFSDFDINLFTPENKTALTYWPDEETRYRIFCKWQPGDILWVRETWRKQSYSYADEDKNFSEYQYAATWPQDCLKKVLWKPSIFMPRTACRICLQITDIKVERLQKISEEDAKAEGVEQNRDGSWHDYVEPNRLWQDCAKASFQSLWLKINDEESWQQNPFVWAITFEKQTPLPYSE